MTAWDLEEWASKRMYTCFNKTVLARESSSGFEIHFEITLVDLYCLRKLAKTLAAGRTSRLTLPQNKKTTQMRFKETKGQKNQIETNKKQNAHQKTKNSVTHA